MFFKISDVDIRKKYKHKIELVNNGTNLAEIIENLLKCQEYTMVLSPSKNQKEFTIEFNSHIGDNKRVKKSVHELEHKSSSLNDYVVIHKDDYANFEKFTKQYARAISLEQQQEIRIKAKKGLSQRAIAKEYKVSATTINKILNFKY